MDVVAIARERGVNARVNGEVEVNMEKRTIGDAFLRNLHSFLVMAVSSSSLVVYVVTDGYCALEGGAYSGSHSAHY